MAKTPNKPCRKCKRILTTSTYCPACQTKVDARQKATAKRYDTRRGTTASRGYDAGWQRVRIEAKETGLWICQCARCKAMGRIKAIKTSDPVHHIKPVETHPELRLELSNLISMTRHCHEAEENRAADQDFNNFMRAGR